MHVITRDPPIVYCLRALPNVKQASLFIKIYHAFKTTSTSLHGVDSSDWPGALMHHEWELKSGTIVDTVDPTTPHLKEKSLSLWEAHGCCVYVSSTSVNRASLPHWHQGPTREVFLDICPRVAYPLSSSSSLGHRHLFWSGILRWSLWNGGSVSALSLAPEAILPSVAESLVGVVRAIWCWLLASVLLWRIRNLEASLTEARSYWRAMTTPCDSRLGMVYYWTYIILGLWQHSKKTSKERYRGT